MDVFAHHYAKYVRAGTLRSVIPWICLLGINICWIQFANTVVSTRSWSINYRKLRVRSFMHLRSLN